MCSSKAPWRRHSSLCQGTATPLECIAGTPFGRASKRASAALRSLELARLVQRSRALHLHASRSAERVITSDEDIQIRASVLKLFLVTVGVALVYQVLRQYW